MNKYDTNFWGEALLIVGVWILGFMIWNEWIGLILILLFIWLRNEKRAEIEATERDSNLTEHGERLTKRELQQKTLRNRLNAQQAERERQQAERERDAALHKEITALGLDWVYEWKEFHLSGRVSIDKALRIEEEGWVKVPWDEVSGHDPMKGIAILVVYGEMSLEDGLLLYRYSSYKSLISEVGRHYFGISDGKKYGISLERAKEIIHSGICQSPEAVQAVVEGASIKNAARKFGVPINLASGKEAEE